MLKFALIGSNVEHSLSKFLHENYAAINNKKVTYDLISVANLEDFITNKIESYQGINVTFPYKQDILRYLDYSTKQVNEMSSCNVVTIKAKKRFGENSDYYGFKFYFTTIYANKNFTNALVFGYGGSSQSVIQVLKDLNINYTVANRTLSKVKESQKLSLSEANLRICEFDLIINTTTLGYNNDNILTNEVLNKNTTLIDLNYKPYITPFLQTGIANNCLVKNGLDMLIVQAIIAQEIWMKNAKKFKLKDYLTLKLRVLKKKLLIDGFMGSGKTKFCVDNDLNFIDLDTYIEKKENMTISEIFANKGEKYFRTIERKYLIELMESSIDVIALGGGCSYYNCDIIKNNPSIIVVYIATPLLQIKANIALSTRPLKNDILELYNKRLINYQLCSEIKIKYIHNNSSEMFKQLIREL